MSLSLRLGLRARGIVEKYYRRISKGFYGLVVWVQLFQDGQEGSTQCSFGLGLQQWAMVSTVFGGFKFKEARPVDADLR